MPRNILKQGATEICNPKALADFALAIGALVSADRLQLALEKIPDVQAPEKDQFCLSLLAPDLRAQGVPHRAILILYGAGLADRGGPTWVRRVALAGGRAETLAMPSLITPDNRRPIADAMREVVEKKRVCFADGGRVFLTADGTHKDEKKRVRLEVRPPVQELVRASY